jgi:hypothetical protein
VAKPVPMEPLLKVEQASQSALSPLSREGLAVLLPPQRFSQVHLRLAPLSMSGSDLALDVLNALWIASTHLNVFQFNFGGKVDVT